MEGEPQDIGGSGAEHVWLYRRHGFVQQRAEERASGHHDEKSGEYAEVEGQGAAESVAPRVRHRHDVVRAGCNRGQNNVRQERRKIHRNDRLSSRML